MDFFHLPDVAQIPDVIRVIYCLFSASNLTIAPRPGTVKENTRGPPDMMSASGEEGHEKADVSHIKGVV